MFKQLGHSGDWDVSGIQRVETDAGSDWVLLEHGMPAVMEHCENIDHWFKCNTPGGAEKGRAE